MMPSHFSSGPSSSASELQKRLTNFLTGDIPVISFAAVLPVALIYQELINFTVHLLLALTFLNVGPYLK